MPDLVLMTSPCPLPALGLDVDVNLTVFISSNLLELPEYRRAALDVCQREELWPLMIERLADNPAEALRESLRLVEQASIYLGIFSHIDGSELRDHDRSRIKMECDRARMRGLPRLIFIGRDEHLKPLAAAELEASQQWPPFVGGGVSLEFFTDPYDLRAALGMALAGFRAQARGTMPPSSPPPSSPLPPARSPDALAAPLNAFESLVDQGRYDQAYGVFRASLYEPMCVRLSLCDDAADCLERLFPEGLEASQKLSNKDHRLSAVWTLAYCYQYSGRVALAAGLWQKILDAHRYPWLDLFSTIRAWHNLSESRVDDLFAAEQAARESLLLAQQVGGTELGTSLTNLGVLLSLRGRYLQAFSVFKQAIACPFEADKEHDVGLYAEFSYHALRTGHVDMAVHLAEHAHELLLAKDLGRPAMRVLNLLSAISEARGELEAAVVKASSAMTWAQSLSYRSEEIRSLICLARLHVKQRNLDLALDFLKQLWPLVERGPYPQDRARGLNILARLELQRGHSQAAAAAALEALKLAGSASGPPFANPRQMAEARWTLDQLGFPAAPDPSGCRESPLPAVTIGRHTI